MKDRSKILLRYAMAEQAFLEAGAMADHLAQIDYAKNTHLYHACVTGMVVSYCRPFTAAEGLGKLSDDFEKFDDAEDPKATLEIHQNLIIGRNKVLAHFDLNFGKELYQRGHYPQHPGEIILHLQENGYGVRTTQTTMAPNAISRVKQLVEHQVKRLEKCKNDFVVSLVKSGQVKLGFYVLTPQN